MPWTFAHPAAVVPLRRYCPERLNFAALVTGSISPDLGYYIHRFDLAHFAHSLLGSLLACLPAGLFLLGVLYLLREPLRFLLPQPHRAALAPISAQRFSLHPGKALAITASVLLGAWTHIAWDSCTHREGWLVSRITLLQEPLLRLGAAELPVYAVLQHLSTLGGIAVLLMAYSLWLRSRHKVVLTAITESDDHWRYAFLITVAALALAIALPLALKAAATAEGLFAVRVFLFYSAVYGAAIAMALLIPCSIVCYAVHGKT